MPKCEQCGIEFPTRRDGSRNRFCSHTCHTASRHHPKEIKICEICGKAFPARARSQKDSNRACSRACGFWLSGRAKHKARPDKECLDCHRIFPSKLVKFGRCDECRGRYRATKQVWLEQRREPISLANCVECGKEIKLPYRIPGWHLMKCCSRECSQRIMARERRGREWDTRSEKVSFYRVYESSNGRCYLCGQVAPRMRGSRTGCLLHMAVVDHVHPLALRGENLVSNARIAHHICNSVKGATLLPEDKSVPGWLRDKCRDRLTRFIFEAVQGKAPGVTYALASKEATHAA